MKRNRRRGEDMEIEKKEELLLPLMSIENVREGCPELKEVVGVLEKKNIQLLCLFNDLLQFINNLGEMTDGYRDLKEQIEQGQKMGYYALCYDVKPPQSIHDFAGHILCDPQKRKFEYLRKIVD